MLADGKGGEHGDRLATRKHYRQAFASPENSTQKDISFLDHIRTKLGRLVVAEGEAAKSWYKTGPGDIAVVSGIDPKTVVPLSKNSNVVLNMRANNQVLLYVKPEDANRANGIVREESENERNIQGSFGFAPGIS